MHNIDKLDMITNVRNKIQHDKEEKEKERLILLYLPFYYWIKYIFRNKTNK